MLQPIQFTYGENPTQKYYFYENKETRDLVQIIRNNHEDMWFGLYNHNYVSGDGDAGVPIPVLALHSEKKMLESVCDWYNVNILGITSTMEVLWEPLLDSQIRARKDEENYIEGIVPVTVSHMIENNLEGFLEVLSAKLTGRPTLANITYEIVGHEDQDTVLMKVSGDVTSLLLEL